MEKAPRAYMHLALIGIAPVFPRGKYCAGVVLVDKYEKIFFVNAGSFIFDALDFRM